MPTPPTLDALDYKILNLLLQNAKRPYTDLAQELFVSGGTIHVRMNKLIAAGVVQGQTLIVNNQALGYDVSAFLGIYLKGSGLYAQAAEHLRGIPEVVMAHYTTGVYSLFARVVCRDTDHLREVLGRVQAFEGIQRTETFISLEATIERPVQLEEAHD